MPSISSRLKSAARVRRCRASAMTALTGPRTRISLAGSHEAWSAAAESACAGRLGFCRWLLQQGQTAQSSPRSVAPRESIEGCLRCEGRGRHPSWGVPGDLGEDSAVATATGGVKITTGAAEITPNTRRQRGRSVPAGENALSGACGHGLRCLSASSTTAWGVENALVKASKLGRIVNVAGDGRQQKCIWEMSGQTGNRSA